MSYLDDIEYAARNLIELAMSQRRKIDELKPRLTAAESKFKVHQWDYETSEFHEDFSDAQVMDAFHRMATAGQERDALQSEMDTWATAVGARQVAIQSISGALLQIAKQGISLVHGSLKDAPRGRMIGRHAIRDVIWYARNQAMHYEEKVAKKPVQELFASLVESHGCQFSLPDHPHMSRATQVLELLEWRTYDQFEADLRALGL